MVKVKGFKELILQKEKMSGLIEKLPEAILHPKLKLTEYFNHFFNHGVINVDDLKKTKNTAFFYYAFKNCDTFPIKIIKTISFESENIRSAGRLRYSSGFFDDLALTVNSRFIPCDTDGAVPAVQIIMKNYVTAVQSTMKNYIVGYYLPQQNVLFATDWTHSDSSLELFVSIWEYLVKEAKIKKVKESKTKEKFCCKQKSIKVRITVGCDPEFEVFDMHGRFIPAESFIDDEEYENEIGCDGAGAPLELRPSPGTPNDVVKSLKRLIEIFNREYPDKDVLPTGNIIPIGGHIHIGFDDSFGYIDGNLISASGALNSMIRILDDFIGKRVIDLSGSARGDYKRLSAYEIKPWGFEYRTPPALIFATPEIARIHLKIAKNVIETLSKNKEVEYNDPPTEEDYIRIAKLTKDEYEKFREFVSNPQNYKKSLITAWTGKRVRTASLTIIFQDDWITKIKEEITEAFKKEFFKKRSKKIELVLYGLRQDRGLVSTIPFADIQKLPKEEYPETHPYFIEEDETRATIHIGLPYVVRMDYSTFDKYKKELINAIRSELKKYSQKKNAVCVS